MDWRERDYYLIRTHPQSYEMRHRFYKMAAPSIKYHSPLYFGIDNAQELVSCRKEHSDTLEYELRKAHRRDWGSDYPYMTWKKLNKEMVGQ